MTDPTEVEAREGYTAVEKAMIADIGSAREQFNLAASALRAGLPFALEAWQRYYRAEGIFEAAVRATEREKVRAAFQDLLDVAEDMLPYVPEYFREKWGHDEGVERARLWLDGAE